MPPGNHKRLKSIPLAAPTIGPAIQVTQAIPSCNSQILKLPAELWLEILSYFPAVPIPTRRIRPSPVLPPSTLERSDVLRALSQTCRSLREIFFEQAWERLEACAIRTEKASAYPNISNLFQDLQDLSSGRDEIPGSWYLGVSRTLQIKCEGLSRHPEYAALVRQVQWHKAPKFLLLIMTSI